MKNRKVLIVGDDNVAKTLLMSCKDEIQIAEDESILLVCKDLKGNVPDEIQAIPYGLNKTPKGDFLHDEESQKIVEELFAVNKNDMVIDYEHQTLYGGEAPAAGWVKRASLINKGKEGTWVKVDWTEKARTYIANKEYRYVSPVFLIRESDRRVVRLLNIALTNDPNIDGMVPLVNKKSVNKKKNKEVGMLEKLLAALGLDKDASEDAVMTAVNKLMEGGKVMANKGLLESLGLKEGATAEEIIAGVSGLEGGAAVVANKAVLDVLGLKADASESEITGTIMAMKQSHDQVGTLSKQVADLTSKITGSEAETMVNSAMKEGKITPAQKEWALEYAAKDAEAFQTFIAKAPVVVDPGKVAGDQPPSKEKLEETTLIVSKQMGVSKEDLEKYGRDAN